MLYEICRAGNWRNTHSAGKRKQSARPQRGGFLDRNGSRAPSLLGSQFAPLAGCQIAKLDRADGNTHQRNVGKPTAAVIRLT